jgi:hypothetical protein
LMMTIFHVDQKVVINSMLPSIGSRCLFCIYI